MQFYLVLEHELPAGSPDEYVGPFANYEEAAAHQQTHGPLQADIMPDFGKVAPDPKYTFSPAQHIAYLAGRY
jgi:hypothetical protein